MRRILFTETDFNTLPNPPAGFKYIGFNGPNFTAKDETGISVPTGAAGVVDVTHSNLLEMISTSDLTPGTYYKITDFKTCYDQPDYLFGEYIMYTDIPMNGTQSSSGLYPQYKTGATHSIIVFALDVDKLAPDAYQPDFPKDQIKYDVTWNTTEINEEIAYGRITERIDEFGNRTDYDHREVVFKRYPQYSYRLGEHLLSGTIQMSEDGYIIGTNSTFTDLSEGDVIAIPETWQKLFKITSIVDDYTMSVTGSFIPQIEPGSNLYSTTKDGYFRHVKNNIDDGDYLEFPAFDGNSTRNYFGNKGMTIDLDFLLSNNVFLGTFSGNTFGEFCMNNTITSNQFVMNNLGDAFYGNNITSDWFGNNIGDLCYNNIIHTFLNENNIGTQFSQNEIGSFEGSNYFTNNTILNGFKGNLINGGDFSENQIGYAFGFNEVLGSFYNNQIESYFLGNNTSYEFKYNKIGSWFNWNTISHNFGYNEIANSFNNNTIESDFGYGGSEIRGNKIGNNFENNHIGEYFYDNRIANLFADNTVSNYFQFNDVKSQNLNGVDFTTYNGNILSFSYSFVGTLSNEFVGTTYSGVSGTYSYVGSTASVVDATFDIYVNSTTSVVLTLVDPGKYYLPNIGFTASEIAISDSKFGGTGSNDLSIIITGVSDLPSVYGEYNTEIFTKVGGVNRLSYYDASDVLTITDIDK